MERSRPLPPRIHDDRGAVLASSAEGWRSPPTSSGASRMGISGFRPRRRSPELTGQQVLLRLEAAFGSTMGRSDLACTSCASTEAFTPKARTATTARSFCRTFFGFVVIVHAG